MQAKYLRTLLFLSHATGRSEQLEGNASSRRAGTRVRGCVQCAARGGSVQCAITVTVARLLAAPVGLPPSRRPTSRPARPRPALAHSARSPAASLATTITSAATFVDCFPASPAAGDLTSHLHRLVVFVRHGRLPGGARGGRERRERGEGRLAAHTRGGDDRSRLRWRVLDAEASHRRFDTSITEPVGRFQSTRGATPRTKALRH